MSEVAVGSAPAGVTPEALAAAHGQIVQMTLGPVIAKTVHALAELGIPDLFDSPQSADDIARATGAHAPSMYRLLRMAAGLGFFVEDADRRFALTTLGMALRSDSPAHGRSMVRSLNGPLGWGTLAETLHSVRTGAPAVGKAFGQSLFEFLAARPAEGTLFNETMIGFHGAEPVAVASAYDFSGISTLVDVGGGTGNMLTTILRANPHLRGVVFDQAQVVAEARGLIAERGLADRCDVAAGNFFERVPTGGDAYMLSHIIHDWPEEQCLRILRNCREAMSASGRLLLFEMVIPPGNDFHPAKLLDMIMLTFTGGQERTEAEYASLLAKGGFRQTRVIPTASPVSIVEAVPA